MGEGGSVWGLGSLRDKWSGEGKRGSPLGEEGSSQCDCGDGGQGLGALK